MNTQEIQLVANLLLQTFNEQNNEVRNQVEAQLKQLASQNLLGYLYTCIQIIQNVHQEYDAQTQSHLKNSAALNLRNILRTLSKELNSTTVHQRISLIEEIFRTIVMPMDQHIRTSLGFALNPIFTIEEGQQEIFEKVLPLIFQALSQNGDAVKGGLRTFRAIFNNMNNSSQIQKYFHNFTPQMVEVALKGIAQLSQSINSDKAEKITEEALDILQEWAYTIATILENFDLQCSKYIKLFSDKQELAQIFQQILYITKHNPQEVSNMQLQQSIISTDCSMSSIVLDELKCSVLNSFNIIIGHLFDNKHPKEKKKEKASLVQVQNENIMNNPFMSIAINILPTVINSLIFLTNNPNFDELLEGEFISNLVIELLQLLYKCSSEPQFFQIFSQQRTQILIDICFMFLKINDNEKDTFEESPDEFVALGQDTCERQESETPKTVAAQLLESLCEHIDGSLTYVVQLICKFLDLSLQNQESAAQSIMNLPELQAIANCKFLTQSEGEVIIETSLLALCVIHFSLSKRDDLLDLLEKTLVNNFQALFSINSGIIKCRLNLFYYFFAEYLFHLNENYFQGFLTFVINSLAPENSKAIMIQASETLAYVVQEEDIMMRIDAQIGSIFPNLINAISSASEKAFFDAMMEICQGCTELVNEYLQPLLNLLSQRILAELEKVKVSKQGNQSNHLKKDQLTIVKCWNIIRSICDNKEIIPSRIQEVEQILLNLFLYIREPSEIDFEDDILLCLNSFMKKSQTITQLGWELYQYFPKVQLKYKGGFSHMFVTLNCYILYGKQFLEQNIQYVQFLVEMCKSNIFSTPRKNKLNEALNAEGCLLFQVMLQSLPNILDGELQKIIEAVVTRYLQGQIYCKFLRARLLNVFYCSILYNSQLTMTILSSANMAQSQPPITYLKYLLQETIQYANCFITSYDKKIVILGCCTILMEQNIPTDVSDLIPQLFELIITILTNTDNSQKIQEEKKTNLDMSMSSEDSDEAELKDMKEIEQHLFQQDMDDFLNNETANNQNDSPMTQQELMKEVVSEETEAQLSINQLQSSLQSVDEYQYFQDFIKKLQENALEGLKTLVGQLSQEKQEALKNILSSRRVQIHRQLGENTVVRKIVKAKRKSKNQ